MCIQKEHCTRIVYGEDESYPGTTKCALYEKNQCTDTTSVQAAYYGPVKTAIYDKPIRGCTDSNYEEFDLNANIDNGSCQTLMDTFANMY